MFNSDRFSYTLVVYLTFLSYPLFRVHSINCVCSFWHIFLCISLSEPISLLIGYFLYILHENILFENDVNTLTSGRFASYKHRLKGLHRSFELSLCAILRGWLWQVSRVIYYDFYLRETFDSIFLRGLKVSLGIEFEGRINERRKPF